jgi:hypothetical protein
MLRVQEVSKLDLKMPKKYHIGDIKTLKRKCCFEDMSILPRGTKVIIKEVTKLYTIVQVPKWKFEKAVIAHSSIKWK